MADTTQIQDVNKITVKQLAQRVRSMDSRFIDQSDDMVAKWAVANQPELANRLIDYRVGPTGKASISAPPKGVSRAKEAGWNVFDWATTQMPVAGGVAGGLAGEGMGSIPLAALGGAAGASVRDVLRNKFLKEAPRDLKGEMVELGEEAAIQGINEATGKVMAKPLEAFGKTLSETALRSQQARIPLTPTQAGVGGSAMGWLERFTSHAIPSAGVMEGFFEKQNAKAIQEISSDISAISKFNGTPEQMGLLTQKSIQFYRDKYKKDVLNPAYKEIQDLIAQRAVRVPVMVPKVSTLVDEFGKPMSYSQRMLQKQLQGGVFVDTTPVKQAALPIARALREQSKYLDPKLLADSQAILNKIIRPDFDSHRVPFSVVKDSRSDLLALSRNLEEALPGKRAGIIKRLIGSIDKAMEDAADKSAIPDLGPKVKAANKMTAELHRKFEQGLVKNILDTQKPEMVSGFVRKAGVQEIRDLRAMMSAPQYRALQSSIAKDILAESVDKGTGVINPGVFAKKFYDLGDQRGREVFGPSYGALRQIADVMDKLPGQKAGRITLGSGAAGLHNLSFILGGGAALGSAALGHEGAAMATAVGLGSEALLLRKFAQAITNPAKSARIASLTANTLRGSTYAADALRRTLMSSSEEEP